MQITRQADYAVRAVRYLSILEMKYQENNPGIGLVEFAKRKMKKRTGLPQVGLPRNKIFRHLFSQRSFPRSVRQKYWKHLVAHMEVCL